MHFYYMSHRVMLLQQNPWSMDHKFHNFGRDILAHQENTVCLPDAPAVKKIFKDGIISKGFDPTPQGVPWPWNSQF